MVLKGIGNKINEIITMEKMRLERIRLSMIENNKIKEGYIIDHVDLAYIVRFSNLLMPSIKGDNVLSVIALNVIKPDNSSIYEVVIYPSYHRNEDLSITVKGKYFGDFEVKDNNFALGQKQLMNKIEEYISMDGKNLNKNEFMQPLRPDIKVYAAFKELKL